MYATLAAGSESHKNVSVTRSWILNLYYTNKVRGSPRHALATPPT